MESNSNSPEKAFAPNTDSVSGLMNMRAFADTVKARLEDDDGADYVIARWDIDRFKLYNDAFGIEKGDEVISALGAFCGETAKNSSCIAYAYFGADHFVSCWRREGFSHTRFIENVTDGVRECFGGYSATPCFGFCAFSGGNTDITKLCDRALLALRNAKTDYDRHYQWYDERMFIQVREEQEHFSAMRDALENGEFIPWYQPQYNYEKNELIGAEALVRWVHRNGRINFPGCFMPDFEKNGFIYELDKSVWEQVCRQQRLWIDAGFRVLPVSVNVSRRDLYHEDIIDYLLGLIEKYQLSTDLLHLEITESAYMEDAELLMSVIGSMREKGFHVEIDDFGSGFSSLNMLKDIEVDALKIDLGFMQSSPRSGSILSSVVRLAHSIGLSTIAEGVETRSQADYLKSIGCTEMQGYYFSRPVPVDEYTKLLDSKPHPAAQSVSKAVAVDNAAEFLNADTQATLLFNSFVGGAAIVEYCRGNIAVLRSNDRLHSMIRTDREKFIPYSLHLQDYFSDRYNELLVSALTKSRETGEEQSVRLRIGTAGDSVWTRCGIRYLTSKMDSDLYYVSVEDITEQQRLMLANNQLSSELIALVNNVPCGLARIAFRDNTLRFEYISESFSSMLGFGHAELEEILMKDPLALIHPEDGRDLLARIDGDPVKLSRNLNWNYRLRRRDGKYLRFDISGSFIGKVTDCVLYLSFTDISELFSAKESLEQSEAEYRAAVVQSGLMICRYTFGDKALNVLPEVAEKFDFFTYTRDVCRALVDGGSIAPESVDAWTEMFRSIERGETGRVPELHIRGVSGRWRWYSVMYSPTMEGDESRSAVLCFRDETDERAALKDRAFEFAGMFKAMKAIYSLAIAGNLSRNTYYVLEAEKFINHSVKPEGEFDALIDNGLRCVPAGDRDAFAAAFSRESLMSAFERGEDFIRLEHREYDDAGAIHWVETTVLRVEAPFDRDIVILTLARQIDERKAKEELLRRNLDLVSSRLEISAKENEIANSLSRPGVAVSRYDIPTRTMLAPQTFAAVFGHTSYIENYPYCSADLNYHAVDDDTAERYVKMFDDICSGVPSGSFEGKFYSIDGSIVWQKGDFVTIFDEKGIPQRAVIAVENTTAGHDRDEELLQLRQSERIMRIVAMHSERIIYYCSADLSTARLIIPGSGKPLNFPESICFRGTEISDHLLPESESAWLGFLDSIDRGCDGLTCELGLKGDDGRSGWFDVHYSRIADENGTVLSAVISLLDISSEHTRKLNYLRFRQAASEAMKFSLTQVDVNLTANLCERYEDKSALPITRPLAGLAYTDALKIIAEHHFPDENKAKVFFRLSRENLLGAYADGKRELEEDWIVRFFSDGRNHWVRMNAHLVRDMFTGNIRAFWTLRDISSENTAALGGSALELDALTGIYTRSAVEKLVGEYLGMSPDSPGLFMLIDMDDLKTVNDSFGHPAGDEALKLTAKLLKEFFGQGDSVVGRLGGDEFVVFVPKIDGLAQQRSVIESFQRKLAESRCDAFPGFSVHCCIGCVVSTPGEDDFDSMYTRADTAMYHVKRSGKNGFSFFHRSMIAKPLGYIAQNPVFLQDEENDCPRPDGQ